MLPTLTSVDLHERHELQRVADTLVDTLVKAGVRVVFGVPGGAIAALNDALIDRPEIRTVTTRHEAGAMFAAAAYARATQKVGVVLVTSGPGVLNCMTGLASAHCDGLPVLVIAGEVPTSVHGRHALQEGTSHHLDIVAMSSHLTKMSAQVTQPDQAAIVLRRAMATANSGRRGPVLLTLPLDVASARVRRAGLVADVAVGWALDPQITAKVALTLRSAQRPVMMVGSGARWGEGARRVRELAERLGIPVITSPKAKGVFPETHPLSLGVFGHGGHPSADAYLEGGVDVLLAIGTGMSDPATNNWSRLLIPTRHLIQIDTEAMQIGRNYPVSLGIVGPADLVLGDLLSHLPMSRSSARTYGRRQHLEGVAGPDHVAPGQALREVQRLLPADAIYTVDIGEHLLFATHFLTIDEPDGFVAMTGLASMGSSIAAALGTKLALPDRTTVAVLGDGCFSMALGDLGTAVRERIPLLAVVLNDQRYGMVELGHKALYGRSPAYPCSDVHVVELARGVGAQASSVNSLAALRRCGVEHMLMQGPVVLDVRIDPTLQLPKSPRFDALKKSTGRLVAEAVNDVV